MNLEFLFPPLHGPSRTASAGIRPFADATQTQGYLTQGLKKWRVAPYTDDYQQAADAAQQGEMLYKTANRLYDQIALYGRKTVQGPQPLLEAQARQIAETIARQTLLLKIFKTTIQSYASLTKAYHVLAKAHFNGMPVTNDPNAVQAIQDAQEARFYAQECILNQYPNHAVQHQQLYKFGVWTRKIPVIDRQIDARIPYVDTEEMESLVKEACTAGKKAQKLEREVAYLMYEAGESITKAQLTIVENYVQSIKDYAICSRACLEAVEARIEELEQPHKRTRALSLAARARVDACKKQALASLDLAQPLRSQAKTLRTEARTLRAQAKTLRSQEAQDEALQAQDKALCAQVKTLQAQAKTLQSTPPKPNQLAQIRQKISARFEPIRQKIKPLTAKLPSLPYKSTVKQKVIVGLERNMPRLTLSINRLACALLTIPCSALDAFYHAFWGTVKLALLILRTGIYACSAGRYGTFLQEHVSVTQVTYHAKSTAYYLANMCLGPFIGAYDPDRLMHLQARFEPKP